MKAIRRRVPQRTVSGRHKWISRYPTGGLLHQKLRIRRGILLRLWQPYLGQMLRLLYALPQIYDLLYLVNIVA